jgi:adenylate kinase
MPCDAVVILRASPSELRKRMKAKGWPKEKIEENTEAEIMEVCRAEALEQGRKVLELDTTGRTPKSAAGEIVKKLKKKSWL